MWIFNILVYAPIVIILLICIYLGLNKHSLLDEKQKEKDNKEENVK